MLLSPKQFMSFSLFSSHSKIYVDVDVCVCILAAHSDCPFTWCAFPIHIKRATVSVPFPFAVEIRVQKLSRNRNPSWSRSRSRSRVRVRFPRSLTFISVHHAVREAMRLPSLGLSNLNDSPCAVDLVVVVVVIALVVIVCSAHFSHSD